MLRKGLIERGQAEDDKRCKTLCLTTEGHAQLLSLRPRVDIIEQALTSGLDAQQQVELKQLLITLLQTDAP